MIDKDKIIAIQQAEIQRLERALKDAPRLRDHDEKRLRELERMNEERTELDEFLVQFSCSPSFRRYESFRPLARSIVEGTRKCVRPFALILQEVTDELTGEIEYGLQCEAFIRDLIEASAKSRVDQVAKKHADFWETHKEAFGVES